MTGPLRTVLAVLLAAALLAVGLAAADRAQQSRTATRLDEAATDLVTVADRIATRNDPTPAGTARRVVSVRVPPGGTLRIARDLVEWRVGAGAWHRRRPSGALAAEPPRLVLAPGRHRLTVSLQRRGQTPVVVVTRAARS